MAKAVPKEVSAPVPIGTDSAPSVARLVPALVHSLTAAQLFASPLNPRRTPAPPDKEQELEDSIVEKGLLQPIVARPAKGDSFEIICGCRRHARISHAIEASRLPSDYQIPTLIREASDEDLIVLAGIENLERQDMHPLDEAELFKTLFAYVRPGKGEDAGTLVAKKLHVGRRTVFRRLALLRLDPQAQEALRAGKLQLQEASALALGEPEAQRQVLKQIVGDGDSEDGGRRYRVDEIKREMTQQKVLLRIAAFDPVLYTGERIVDPESGETWLTDLKQFDTLQKQALAARIASLEKKWPWVHVIADGRDWNYSAAHGDKEAGAIAYIDRHRRSLVVKEGVLSPEIRQKREAANAKRGRERARNAGGADKTKAEKRYLTDGQAVAVKHAKTQAMRLGLAADGHVALALGCLALLDPDSEVNLREESGWHQRREENKVPPSKREAEILAHRLKQADVSKVGARSEHQSRAAWSSKTQAEAFAKLLKLKPQDLLTLYAALIAGRVGTWFDSEHRIGDSPLAIAIAKAVGATERLPETWKPTEEHFKAHSREVLEALALATGTYAVDLPKLKKGELVAALVKRPAGTWAPDKFKECRFLTDADMKKAFAEAASPAKPATAKKGPKPKKAAKRSKLKPTKKKAA